MNKIAGFLSKDELRLINSLNTPDKIQEYIDDFIIYDPYREDRTIREVIKDKKGECYNSALFATACLLNAGFETSVIELLAKEDEEHILSVYKKDGLWGSIAQSKFAGLKGRKPIYKSVHDLVVSYQEFYFAFDGHYSLASYTNPISLNKYHFGWLHVRESVVELAKDLRLKTHFPLTGFEGGYHYVSPMRYWREVLYIPKGVKIPEIYLSHKPDHVDVGKLREK